MSSSNELIESISSSQAWSYRIIPVAIEENLREFQTDSISDSKLHELKVIFNSNIKLHEVPVDDLAKQLSTHYRRSDTQTENVTILNTSSDNIIQRIITEAQSLGSSDIHIEYYKDHARVRYRIDGKLMHRFTLSHDSYKSITNQFKLRSGLNLAETRRPQDGRMDASFIGKSIDIRTSVIPVHGNHEKVVLRILEGDSGNITLNDLGFSEKQLSDYRTGIMKTSGIVLISGPTGSGKTTTLYATLKELNKVDLNIMTIENPIEYVLPGINQVQVNHDIGFTFASALKTFLRQDPDVIMVGEIRDPETAEMAVRASLTGHLVLSTIHTNSAIGTIGRLQDMGVPEYLIADTLNTSIAQRLVRLLCNNCKVKSLENDSRLSSLGIDGNQFELHEAQGCHECHFTGYKGRTALYEIINLDNDLRDKIKSRTFSDSVKLNKSNYVSLQQSAISLLKNGITSVDEVYPILLSF